MASWCSRLARQPVTLEVDGSSPFEVAKKRKAILLDGFSFFVDLDTDSNHLNATVQWGAIRALPAADKAR